LNHLLARLARFLVGPPFALVGLLLVAVVIRPFAAQPQQAAKVYRIGVLATGGSFSAPLYMGLREELRALGYVQGGNTIFEFRSAEGRPERLPALAEDLVQTKPDVIVAPSTPAATAIQRFSRTIPVVFALAADPVGSGLAASLARPGGNATGLSIVNTELAGKRLELLKETLPTLSRVAVLWAVPDSAPAIETVRAIMRETESSARTLGLVLDLVKIEEASQLEGAFSTIHSRRHQALVVLPTPVFAANVTRIADLSVKARLAVVADGRQFADAGGLMAYGASYADQLRRAATYVDKILKGAKPGDLPIERPTKFELVINLKTAKTLGLTIPSMLLLRADHVIE
jgi:putative ABC transport system substrate-binding protein